GLQGDDAVQAELAGLVNDAHAAAAQHPQHLVVGEMVDGLGRPGRRDVGARRLSRGTPGEPDMVRLAGGPGVGPALRRGPGRGWRLLVLVHAALPRGVNPAHTGPPLEPCRSTASACAAVL